MEIIEQIDIDILDLEASGDINIDNDIDVLDVVHIVNLILKEDPNISNYLNDSGLSDKDKIVIASIISDMNRDNIIDVLDIVVLKNAILYE